MLYVVYLNCTYSFLNNNISVEWYLFCSVVHIFQQSSSKHMPFLFSFLFDRFCSVLCSLLFFSFRSFRSSSFSHLFRCRLIRLCALWYKRACARVCVFECIKETKLTNWSHYFLNILESQHHNYCRLLILCSTFGKIKYTNHLLLLVTNTQNIDTRTHEHSTRAQHTNTRAATAAHTHTCRELDRPRLTLCATANTIDAKRDKQQRREEKKSYSFLGWLRCD